MATEQAKQRRAERRRAKRAQRRQAQQQQVKQRAPKQKPHVKAVTDAFSVYTSQGAALARQMALPSEYAEFSRIPTVDMPSTAVLRSVETSSIAVKADMTIALYGQGGRMASVWPLPYAYVKDDEVITSVYFLTKTGGKATGQPLIPDAADGIMTYEGTEWFRPEGLHAETLPTNNFYYFGGTLKSQRPIAMSQGRAFLWFDVGERITLASQITPVSSSSLPFVNPLRVTFYRWLGPQEPHRLAATTEFTSTTDVDLDVAGYYTWSYTFVEKVAATGQPSISVTIKAKTSSLNRTAFLSASTLGEASVGDTARRTAASLLLTNNSSELKKGGNIVAARVLPNDDGYADNTIDPGKKADKFVGAGAKGCYTYMDFDSDAEAFSQSFNNSGYPTCLLDTNSYIHIIKISPPIEFSEFQSYQLTITGLFEFRTDSMLFQRSVPMMSHDALIEARRVNNATMYFYENPLHMADIWRYIKGAFNGMRRIAVPIGTAISTFNPELAPIAMPLAQALQI